MALISKTDIANLAASHIGAENQIADLASDKGPIARICRTYYDVARREALEYYDWSFARKFQTLASHDDGPADNWTYVYRLPSDCITPRSLVKPSGHLGDKIPYIVIASADGISHALLTHLDEAVLRYTFDQTNPHMFTPKFVMSFSFQLAGYIAYDRTKKKSLRDDMFTIAREYTVESRGTDANTNEAKKQPPDVDWIKDRDS